MPASNASAIADAMSAAGEGRADDPCVGGCSARSGIRSDRHDPVTVSRAGGTIMDQRLLPNVITSKSARNGRQRLA
jgi:hypothetical protein